jgi:hypothetical protein
MENMYMERVEYVKNLDNQALSRSNRNFLPVILSLANLARFLDLDSSASPATRFSAYFCLVFIYADLFLLLYCQLSLSVVVLSRVWVHQVMYFLIKFVSIYPFKVQFIGCADFLGFKQMSFYAFKSYMHNGKPKRGCNAYCPSTEQAV